MREKAKLMDQQAMARAIRRMAHEIIEHNKGIEQICLVGIQRRGVPLAERIADCIAEIEGRRPATASIDITFYRDDLSLLTENPSVAGSSISCNLSETTIILVDDVLYTGRTVRSAIEFLFDLGRPVQVQLAVLIDRGHRELPIRPDYIGKNVPTSKLELVEVHVTEMDGEDAVSLFEREA